MNRRFSIYLLTATLGTASLSAQENGGWNLRQCIDHAIENNLTVMRAENAVEQSKVDVNTAKWARLPNLNGSAGESFNWGRAGTRVKDEATGNEMVVYKNTNSNSTSFSLNTGVPLFTGFQLPNQYELTKLNLKAAMADLEKLQEDISINVTSYFLQALFNQELLKIAREQVLLSQEQVERIERLHTLGKVSMADVTEVKARLAQDDMNVTQADNNYRLSLLDLSQLLELPTPDGFRVTSPDDEDLLLHILTPPDDIYMQAVGSKPGILAAQYRLEGSEKNIRVAQSAYYPQLSFSGSLGTGYYSTVNGRNFKQQMDDNFSKYLGFNLSVPIFNRFTTRNNVRKARLQQQNYTIQLDETKKELYKEIQQAWYSAVAAEAKYKSSVVAVTAQEEAFRLMKEKFENGKSTSIEFNEAKLNLLRSQSDQVQAKYDYVFRSKILDFYKGMPIE